ncbi:MAG: IS1380 family transposase, partial [bacterium]|nr:IS1380 family transposase [bacterium]
KRRVILKSEAIPYPDRAIKNNPRLVVTNLRNKPKRVYEICGGHGDTENRIKELKNDLSIDPTSCSRFLANQFRVLMTAAAYMLYQEIRWQLCKTELARAQVFRIRLALIKVSARITESTRRIVLHLSDNLPFLRPWRMLARAMGTSPAT